MKPTFCEECQFVEPGSRKRSPIYWLCTRFPRTEGMGFVSPNWWVENEPYMKCVNINGGACPLFKEEEHT